MIAKTTLQKASNLIQSTQHPLLVCHVAPDGDAIGSLLGLSRALTFLSKQPVLACADPVPNHYQFIPGAELIEQEITAPFDLVITLDCSDLQRVGHIAETPGFSACSLLNIDHHVTNLNFGHVNIAPAEASSTAEVVLELLEYIQIAVDTDLALCLLTGILTDTRGLRTNNVTIKVVESVLRLMKTGASVPYIIKNTLDRRSTSAMRLWGMALAQLQVKDRIVWTAIPQEMRQSAHYLGNGDAGLVNYLMGAQEADVAAVFVELENSNVEVGFRANPGYDVAQVALELGGGGHTLAAGCTTEGPLETAQSHVLQLLRESIKRQSQAIDAGRNS